MRLRVVRKVEKRAASGARYHQDTLRRARARISVRDRRRARASGLLPAAVSALSSAAAGMAAALRDFCATVSRAAEEVSSLLPAVLRAAENLRADTGLPDRH